MDIDAIIATATLEVAPEQTASKIEANEQPESKVELTTPEKEDLSTKTDEELTPEQLAKRVKNRQSHENSKLAAARREKRELKAEIERLKQQTPTQPKTEETGRPVKPQLDSFNTYEEYEEAKDNYFEALADFKAEQKYSTFNKQAEQSQAQQIQNTSQAKRVNDIAQAEANFAKATPEYANLIEQHQDYFVDGAMPKEVALKLSKVNQPELAIYALMKEGKLDDVYDMTGDELVMELAEAKVRGQSYLTKPQPISNAPAPIQAARGNAVGKSLEKLDGVSLLKALR